MNAQVERTAQTYVAAVVKNYGPKSALARTSRIRWEYRKNRQPQWLTRAIEILKSMQ
jgi:hypothetical protein